MSFETRPREPRNENIVIRVTSREKQIFYKLAKRLGVSGADFFRILLQAQLEEKEK